MGEFGAVSVVSGHIRGLTNTLPLQVEILHGEFQFQAAFAVASLLTLLAVVTLVAKAWLEHRHGDALAAGARHRGDPMQLTLESLSKRFADTVALNHVDLAVGSGELIALLGPSGSGKTTLLRAIAGLLPVDAGRILFGDLDATSLSLRERRVGFVFQHYALFKHLTVAENIAFGPESQPRGERPSKAEIARRVEDLLERMQLGGYGGRYPEQLSGGQRQRVALARALAIQPRLLLLDEPFGALDAKVRVDLRRWLRQVHDDTGHTTLFVTHDQEEALELADRVVVFNAGRIEQVGTPDDVYRHPQSRFVFDFIGRGGRIEGELVPEGFRVPGFEGCCPWRAASAAPRDRPACTCGPTNCAWWARAMASLPKCAACDASVPARRWSSAWPGRRH